METPPTTIKAGRTPSSPSRCLTTGFQTLREPRLARNTLPTSVFSTALVQCQVLWQQLVPWSQQHPRVQKLPFLCVQRRIHQSLGRQKEGEKRGTRNNNVARRPNSHYSKEMPPAAHILRLVTVKEEQPMPPGIQSPENKNTNKSCALLKEKCQCQPSPEEHPHAKLCIARVENLTKALCGFARK